jgi:hypothetical protein
LECTACKTKAQLALKRCKHFELGYAALQEFGIVDEEDGEANRFIVVIRRPRVLRWCSRCFVQGWMAFFMWAWGGGFCVNTMAEMDGTGHS